MFETWDKNYEELTWDQLEWAHDNNIDVEECASGFGGYSLKSKSELLPQYYLYVPHRETMNADVRLMRKDPDGTATWVYNMSDVDDAVKQVFQRTSG